MWSVTAAGSSRGSWSRASPGPGNWTGTWERAGPACPTRAPAAAAQQGGRPPSLLGLGRSLDQTSCPARCAQARPRWADNTAAPHSSKLNRPIWMKVPSSRLPTPLLLPFIPPLTRSPIKSKPRGAGWSGPRIFRVLFMILYSKLFWEIFYTHHLKNWKNHPLFKKNGRASRMCVWVAWRGIIWEVQTLNNSILSSPPNFRSSRTGGQTFKYKQLTGSNCRLPVDFFFYTMESILWNGMFKRGFACFWQERMGQRVTAEMKFTHQQNFALTETVWAWICLE